MWHLARRPTSRYGLSYRDVEVLLAERGITVDHVTVYRWVQRFTPLLIDAARPCRHVPGDRWFVDETYVKIAGHWVYLYRAIDQYDRVIDVMASQKRDLAATRHFFTGSLEHGPRASEVTTDQAPAYPRVIEELIPAACHVTEQYANNPVEADHGRLKARLRPMRGLKRLRSARVISAGARVRAEPPSRPLRTRLGYRSTASAHSDLHRTRPRHLTDAAQRNTSSASCLRNRPPRSHARGSDVRFIGVFRGA
jgi:IS6 family transposase